MADRCGTSVRYYEDPAAGRAEPKEFADYAGVYELTPGKQLAVFADGKDLFELKTGRPRELLIAEAGDIFFRKGVEGRWLFRRAENGKVDAVIDRRNNEDVVWRKIK